MIQRNNRNFSLEDVKTYGLRGLAAIGFIALLFGGLWGTVQVVKLTPKIFSGLAAVTTFTSVFVPSETISINTPHELVPSGTSLTLTWDHRGKPENGSYTFAYACRDGVSIDVRTTDGSTTVTCDTPLSITNENQSLSITPHSTQNQFVEVPIVISSLDQDGTVTTLDDSFISIVNESGDLTNNSQENANALVPGEETTTVFPIFDTRTISNTNGQVDLAVTIIGTGVIQGETFVPTSTLTATDQGAIRFSVTNIGSKTSDNWTFNAVLPTLPMHIFHSTQQKALQPGDRIDFTLGFNQINRDLSSGVITINVDPTGAIRNEFDTKNNIAQATITITK